MEEDFERINTGAQAVNLPFGSGPNCVRRLNYGVMKTIFLTRQVCSVMAVCSLLGCASGQQKTSGVKDAKTTEPPAAEKSSAQDAALKEAESQPSEPFEGDGWQPL